MLLQPNDTDERCGVIMSDDTIIEIENVAQDKANAFELHPDTFLKLLKTGAVKGTWHTHPNETPHFSTEDYLGFMSWPDLTHSIIGVVDGQNVVKTYRIEDGVIVE